MFILPTLALYLLLLSNSAMAQLTWTSPALLDASTADAGLGYRPYIETDGTGTWMTVWRSIENVGGTVGTDSDLFASTSMDNGATWTAKVVVNTNATIDTRNEGFPQVTTDGAGNWVVAWYSAENLGGTAGVDSDIFVTTSTDNGTTWTPTALLNANGTTDLGHDRVPRLTTDAMGNWVAVWYSGENLGGTAFTDLDIFVATSTDAGATWITPALLNTNGTTDTGSDSLPHIETDGVGNWVVVWVSNEDLGQHGGYGQRYISCHVDGQRRDMDCASLAQY